MKYSKFIVILGLLTLTACGGSDGDSGNATESEPPNAGTPDPTTSPAPGGASTPTPQPCDPSQSDCPKQTTILKKGIATAPFSGGKDEERYFAIVVPAGATNLMVTTKDGSGDADLYVRFTMPATTKDYDCRPFQTGNEEICDIQEPKTGTYFVMIKGRDNFTNLTLVADYIVDAGSGTGVVNGNCEPTQTQKALLQAHNDARALGRNCGNKAFPAAPALTWSCQLAKTAKGHSEDMAQNDYFDHFSQDGSSPFDRIERDGYRFRTAGENIAAGQSDVASVMDGWLDSPGHCSNIMSANMRELGAAKAEGPNSTYRFFWTAVFATPL